MKNKKPGTSRKPEPARNIAFLKKTIEIKLPVFSNKLSRITEEFRKFLIELVILFSFNFIRNKLIYI